MYTHVLTINLVNFSARYIFRFAFSQFSYCLFVFFRRRRVCSVFRFVLRVDGARFMSKTIYV